MPSMGSAGLAEQAGDQPGSPSGARNASRRRGVFPALGADERDEPHPAQLFLPILALTGSRHAHELLLARRGADGDDQPPADGELRPEGVRHRGAARRDHDRVVGRMLGPPERPVAVQDVDIVEAEVLHSASRQLR